MLLELFGKDPCKSLMDNHLHNIVSHFPECFEEGPLSEISTERFESFISKLIKKTHNFHPTSAIFGIMVKKTVNFCLFLFVYFKKGKVLRRSI